MANREFKLWEKRGIGGEYSEAVTMQARSAKEAAEAHCKAKGYRSPAAYTNDTFKVQVNYGARVFFHYIRVQRA